MAIVEKSDYFRDEIHWDLNGDGITDITDVSFLLNFLSGVITNDEFNPPYRPILKEGVTTEDINSSTLVELLNVLSVGKAITGKFQKGTRFFVDMNKSTFDSKYILTIDGEEVEFERNKVYQAYGDVEIKSKSSNDSTPALQSPKPQEDPLDDSESEPDEE